ncbi:MAG: cell division protein ZapA [Bacteroidales bacterium]|nr:cell division protein ZapA [Bacteroidales bacterium]
MMETIHASVSILGRTYKLRVAAEDEAALRKAAEAIDSQAKQYGNMYAYNDHQDLLAMVALTQITQLTKIQESLRFKDTDLAQRLQSIDSVLEGILHPTQNSL